MPLGALPRADTADDELVPRRITSSPLVERPVRAALEPLPVDALEPLVTTRTDELRVALLTLRVEVVLFWREAAVEDVRPTLPLS